VLLPACDRARRRFRIYDTLRDAEIGADDALKAGLGPQVNPILYTDGDGQERSSWPQHRRLTMDWIRRERQTYFAFASGDIWEREFMMNAATQADRVFAADTIRVEHVERTWHAVYAMIRSGAPRAGTPPYRLARGRGSARSSSCGGGCGTVDAGRDHRSRLSPGTRLSAGRSGIEQDGLTSGSLLWCATRREHM